MQTTGYVIVGMDTIFVLVSEHKTYRSLKRRMSGTAGIHLKDEEIYLRENRDTYQRLVKGEVITRLLQHINNGIDITRKPVIY